jgi:orotate phosphoribosyltransferase
VFESFEDADCLAGVATAGIAWGAMVADQLKLPYVYVRPKPKEHGLGNQIEGNLSKGTKVIVIEDLVSTGKSSLQVCEVLQKAGVEVLGMVAIFTYGFDAASKAFENANIPLKTLTNYATLIELAVENGTVSQDQYKTLLNWSADPVNWGGV